LHGVMTYPQSLNPYMYAVGNPVLHTDPSGEIIPFIVIVIVGGVIVGAVTGVSYDVMVNQGRGGWENIISGAVFTPSHYCNINWGQVALHGGVGAVIGLVVSGTMGEAVVGIYDLADNLSNTSPTGLSDPIGTIPWSNPTQPPGPNWQWRGDPNKPVGSEYGAWFNPKTGESLHPDPHHGGPRGSHWDYVDPRGNYWRVWESGRIEPNTQRGNYDTWPWWE